MLPRNTSWLVTAKQPDGATAGEIAWDAVINKDRHFDGKFVYAAVTTGIYCRPSCPARNPKRRHTLIFSSVEKAERQGYIPCLRCHPGSLAPAEKGIETALGYIETHLNQPITLKTLSRISGISPNHLREIFKRIVGLSPKDFCDARRICRFKQHLRTGQSVSRACYDAGYGSSRALYECAREGLGMTPAVFRSGAEKVCIHYAICATTLGIILLARTDLGICSVHLGVNEEMLIRELREEFPNAVLREEPGSMWKSVVMSCHSEDPLLCRLPERLQGRILKARLWNAMRRRISGAVGNTPLVD